VARLEHVETLAVVVLGARHLVGRSRATTLRITDDAISSVHAEFIWDGERWQLRDLGSRNGTFLEGRKLAAGELTGLGLGMMLTFGSAAHRYRVLDLEAPELMAIAEDGTVRVADFDMLSLPDGEHCELTIFRDLDGAWVCERDSRSSVIDDHELVVAGDRTWRICIPGVLARTHEVKEAQTLAEVELEFFVSRDQEHVEVTIVRGERVEEPESRAHVLLLLELARARLADAELPHLAASEHGWRYREQLIDRLDVDLQLLNLWVFRARKQFAEAGVIGAAGLFERRSGTQQLRIGVAKLRIIDA
jgi:hypothetical protein